MEQRSAADLDAIGLTAWERLQAQQTRVQADVRRDTHQAERAERLAAFLKSDVWQEDVLDILGRMHDAADAKMTSDGVSGEQQLAWAYYKRALQEFIGYLGGSVQLGQGAIRRLAERRFGRIRGLEGR